MEEKWNNIEEFINSIKAIDDMAKRKTKRKSKLRTSKEMRDQAERLVDNAIKMAQHSYAPNLSITPETRNRLIGVVAKGSNIQFENYEFLYVRALLIYFMSSTRSNGDAVMCGFLLGYAYRDMEYES